MRSAWLKAVVKLCLGFFVIGAAIGIRIVTATPVGLEQDIETLERSAATSAGLPADVGQVEQTDDPPPPNETSLVEQMGSEFRARLPAGDDDKRDGDRMVSCRLAGGTQFMTADTCAMRGGQAKVFESER